MPGNEQLFQQAMNQGHSAAWDQEWIAAADFYRQALQELPEHPKALTSLALALYQLENYEEALQAYQQAAKASPNDPLPLEKVGELLERTGHLERACEVKMRAAEMYVQMKEVEKAIKLWSDVVSLRPDHLMAHSRLGLVYERLGRKQQAINEYLAIASLLQASGEVAKAIQAATHASQIIPESRETAQYLSMLQTGQQLPRPARPRGGTGPLLMAQVRQLDAPKETTDASLDPVAEARQKALTVLAGTLFEQSEEDQEAQASRRGIQALVRGTGILSSVDQTKVLLHLSQMIDFQSRGEHVKALDELERAMDAGLDAAAAYFDLGLLRYETGRLESAVRDLQRSVKHVDFSLGSHLILGQIYQKMGKFKEGAAEALEALKLADSQVVSADQADALAQMYEPVIEAYAQQSDPKAQERLTANVIELLLRPSWRQHLKRARQQLPAQQDGSPPMPLAEILSEARSSHVVDAISKINQLARTGQYRTAMEEAFYALQFAPTYLPLHISMAELLLKQERVAEAVDKLTVVSRSYSIRGETMRSIDVLRRIIVLAPMNMEPRIRLIETLVARGYLEDAIGEYMKLADVYYSLADLATARRSCTQALRLAQQANVDRSWKTKILYRMADMDLQSLDWRQAQRVFEQIRTLQPNDEKAVATLIDLNYRLNQSLQAVAELDNFIGTLLNAGQKAHAIQFVETIMGEHPKQAAVRRRLAELYRQSGRSKDAIEQLDVAGDLLLESGDRNGAIETIMAILALNPPNISEYQQALAELQRNS